MLEVLAETLERFLIWLFAVLLIEPVFYPFGRRMLRIVTVGRYPPAFPAQRTREFIALLPLVVVIATITIWFS